MKPSAYVHRYVTGTEPLRALARDAAQEKLAPLRIEHDLDWLALTDHGEGATPGAIAVAEADGGRLLGYAPYRRRVIRLPLRVGEIAVARLPYATLELFGDAIVAREGSDGALAPLVLDALASVPVRFEAVSFDETSAESAISRAIDERGARALSLVERRRARHHLIDLPDSYASYFQSISTRTRTNLRRSARELDTRFGSFRVRRFTRKDEVEALLAAVEQVVKKTFHYHLLGQDLTLGNRRLRKNMELWAERGWLRAYVLFGGQDRPVAYVIGFLVARSYQYELIGYDPDHARASPGIVLLANIIEELIGERAAGVIDFGAGDAEYKNLFGNRSFEERSFWLTRSSAYARGAILAERLFARASRLGAESLDRLGLKGRAKAFFRRASSMKGGAARAPASPAGDQADAAATKAPAPTAAASQRRSA